MKVGNRTLRIRVEGSGPALLLLNGLTRPLENWEPFVAALSERTIITFDAPGNRWGAPNQYCRSR